MHTETVRKAAVGTIDPTAIAADCYACPGCGRDPLVTVGSDGNHTIIGCGVHDCSLSSPVLATGNTPAQAAEVWNRRVLDCGDWLADAETERFESMPRPVALPTTPRASAAFKALCAVSKALTTPGEVARAVGMMESAETPRAVLTALMWLGVADHCAPLLAAELGYPVDGAPLCTCWECRRPLAKRERRSAATDGHGRVQWVCSDCKPAEAHR